MIYLGSGWHKLQDDPGRSCFSREQGSAQRMIGTQRSHQANLGQVSNKNNDGGKDQRIHSDAQKECRMKKIIRNITIFAAINSTTDPRQGLPTDAKIMGWNILREQEMYMVLNYHSIYYVLIAKGKLSTMERVKWFNWAMSIMGQTDIYVPPSGDEMVRTQHRPSN